MNKKFFLLLFSIVLSLHASAYSHSLKSNVIDVRIISDNGIEFPRYRTFPLIRPQGIYYYMEALKGEKYSIEVANRSDRRIGVVIAVDGRNIISGEKSYLNNHERMYIIEPYSTNTFEGWRTGMERVNRFYFTEQSDSYAERVFADASAMGTIAAAIYRELIPEPTHISPLRNSESRAQGAQEKRHPGHRDGEKSSDQAGTGFGNTIYSPVKIVQFNPERTMFQKIVLKYEWKTNLCRKGVIYCDSPNRLWPADSRFAPMPYDFRE